jgi:hypothetical protein
MPLSLMSAADLHWDAASNVLRVEVSTTRGTYLVTIPMSQVAFEFRAAAAEEAAVGEVDILGDVEILGFPIDTVGGLWGSIKHAAKKAYHATKKVVHKAVKKVRHIAKHTVATAFSGARWTLKQSRAVVNSPYMKYGLLAASVACPAVGGPAMAAWLAAKAADKALTAGGSAARSVSSAVRRLNSSPHSVFRSLSLSALKTVG